jgi:hypothetical protein
MAAYPTGQTAIVATQDKVFPSTFTVAGSAAANTTYTCTMYPFGLQNPSTSTNFQVPSGSNYQLSDIYISSTPSIDCQIIFSLNGVTQGENLILSTLVASNSSRVRMTQPLLLHPSDVFTVQVITAAANTLTTTVAETFYLHFLQVPA